MSLTVLWLAGVAFLLYRYRVQHLLALERVRTHIATDLHDDIGSSLSQVSVLSEVIQRRVGSDPVLSEPLSTIASLSRDLIDSMNDIVWAINPRRDHLSDLTHRMRRFASDVFTARNIEFDFSASNLQRDLKIGADLRREVFLIFKEGVNNIIRHSGCSQASIAFGIESGWIEMTLTDNGKGFDLNRASDGNGLSSMRRRAGKLAGVIEIGPNNGHGTIVKLRAPLKRLRWFKQ